LLAGLAAKVIAFPVTEYCNTYSVQLPGKPVVLVYILNNIVG